MPKPTKRTGKSGALSARTRAKLDRKREREQTRAALHEGAKAEKASARRRERAGSTSKSVSRRIERIGENPSRAAVDALADIVASPHVPARERVDAAKLILDFAHNGAPRAKRKTRKCPKTSAPKK